MSTPLTSSHPNKESGSNVPTIYPLVPKLEFHRSLGPENWDLEGKDPRIGTLRQESVTKRY